VSGLDTKEEEKRSFYAANFQEVNINPDPGSCGAETRGGAGQGGVTF